MKTKLPFLLVAIVLISIIYSSITQIRFAFVDDKWMLLDEKLIIVPKVDWDFLKQVFTRINSLQYSPLNTLYYYFIYQINGYDPYYYHLGSFIIHALNVLLVFILVRKILILFKISNIEILAYGVALIWAVLPLNVESVIWISASKILLYTFFGLISFILFLDAFLEGSKYLYVASIVTFILSFLAKEQAVLFPFMMILFVFTYQQKNKLGLSISRMLKYISPFFILALIFGLVTLYTVIYGGGSHDIERFPFSQRIVLMFYCICFYIFNNFIPVNLHYHYAFPIHSGQSLPFIYYLYPVLLLSIMWQFFVLAKKKTNFYLYLFCFGIFMIHLILCIQLVPLPRAAMIADRYMYIPSVGLLLIAAVILNENFDLSFKKMNRPAILISFAFVIYMLFLTVSSYDLVENWKKMQL
jgi:hypothetical protein